MNNKKNIIVELHKELNTKETLQEKENYLYNLKLFIEDLENDIHNEKIGITEDNLKEKIKEFLHEKYEYNFDKKNNEFIFEYYKDYSEYVDIKTIQELLETDFETRTENFFGTYNWFFGDWEDMILNDLTNEFTSITDYREHDVEIQDTLLCLITFDYYKEFLKDKYKIEYFKNNRYYYKTLTLEEILNKEKKVYDNITDVEYIGR